MKHTKKILSKYFQAILDGSKTFEIRKEDDCKYEVGDLIDLIEVYEDYENNIDEFLNGEPSCHKIYVPTGKKATVVVTYRLSHTDFYQGIQEGYVVLGINRKKEQ